METSQEIIELLRENGFYDIVLPWLFTFAITLPLLRMIFVKKDKDGKAKPVKMVPEILAMIIATYLIFYSPANQSIQGFFTELFGGSIMVLAGLFIIILFFSFLGTDMQKFLKCPLAPIWALILDKKMEKVLEDCKRDGAFRSFGLVLVFIGAVLLVSSWGIKVPVMNISPQYMTLGGIVLLIIAIIILFKQPPEEKSGSQPAQQPQQQPQGQQGSG